MKLNWTQLKKLNAYIGCGPHKNADLLIMGNEEGAGGYPKEIEAHSTARFRLYGKDPKTVTALLESIKTNRRGLHHDNLHQDEKYTNSLDGNWENGFWEEDDIDGGNKIEQYILARDGNLEKVELPPSPFLQYCSRMGLALEDRGATVPLDKGLNRVSGPWTKPKPI